MNSLGRLGGLCATYSKATFSSIKATGSAIRRSRARTNGTRGTRAGAGARAHYLNNLIKRQRGRERTISPRNPRDLTHRRFPPSYISTNDLGSKTGNVSLVLVEEKSPGRDSLPEFSLPPPPSPVRAF